MKPLNCCNNCDGVDEEGYFRNKLRCMFCDKYAREQYLRLYNEFSKKKGCSTCKNCKRVFNYPSFVTAEECICTVGLKCDTVTCTVENCPKWVGVIESEEQGMKVYKCDRCGELFEGYEGQGTSVFFNVTTDPCSTGSCLDLCPDCNVELQRWIHRFTPIKAEKAEDEETKLGIDIGDEVADDYGSKGVVVGIDTYMGDVWLSLLMRNHKVPQLVKASMYKTKTGRHFDAIEKLYKEMKK